MRGMWVVVTAATITAAVAGCSTRNGDQVAGVRAPAQSQTPQASAAVLAAPRIAPPITEADVTFTHPVEQDGRTWWPAAGYNGGIIFSAEQALPQPPGGSGAPVAAQFDQQFWLWDSGGGQWTPLWSNQGDRHESLIDVDRDWALSLLYRNNPGDDWTLRLHHLQTGETRDIVSLHPAATGIDSMGASMPAIGEGMVAYTHKVPAGADQLVERLELYNIASAITTIVIEEPAQGWPVVVNANPSIGAGRLAWVRRATGGATTELVLQDLASGKRETVPSTGDETWVRLMADGAHVIGQSRMPADSTKPRDLFARDLATGDTVKYLNAVVWGVVAYDKEVSWWGAGAPGDPRGYYDPSTNVIHLLDGSIRAWGQSGTVIDGWFFWVEGSIRESATGADTRVLQFVPTR
ncbi:MAG TPA: hypothetical protein VFY90_09560 [Tepidiformaceae bacterium]|nr:hypothetical protein [Tepidiformaceae bacterium]